MSKSKKHDMASLEEKPSLAKKKKNMDKAIKNIHNKKMSIKEAGKKYKISPSSIKSRLEKEEQQFRKSMVFSKEESDKLKNHVLKFCNTQFGITITDLRKMAYEYALKIPDCPYPDTWKIKKMATINWFHNFMSEHPELKRFLYKKYNNSCICIMGCHMGAEGEEAFEELEVRVVISRVYHYLKKEYEYMQTCNDLSHLMNILRRTAEATGVCEQTINSILENEQKLMYSLHSDLPTKLTQKKLIGSVMKDHNYQMVECSIEESMKEPSPEIMNNTNFSNSVSNVDSETETSSVIGSSTIPSDIERLQRDCTSIKSVKVEIMEDDFDEVGQDFIGGEQSNGEEAKVESCNNLFTPPDRLECADEDDEGTLVIALSPSKLEKNCDGVQEMEKESDIMIIDSKSIKSEMKGDGETDRDDDVIIVESKSSHQLLKNSDQCRTAAPLDATATALDPIATALNPTAAARDLIAATRDLIAVVPKPTAAARDSITAAPKPTAAARNPTSAKTLVVCLTPNGLIKKRKIGSRDASKEGINKSKKKNSTSAQQPKSPIFRSYQDS